MIKKEIEKGAVLQSQLLLQQAGVSHYSSMRGYCDPGRGVWMPKQVHGVHIVCVDTETPTNESQPLQDVEADAVITAMPGRWIGVRTADCVPVLLYDPVRKVVAAVHAGWRGTVKHITALTVQEMCSLMGCCAQDVFAMIGPSISPESFEVGEEVAEAFVEAGRSDCVLRETRCSWGKIKLSKPHIDLWQSNVMDLMEAGLELDHIDCTPWCTYAHYQEIFSARREGIGTGRIVSAICLDC